MPRGKGTYGSQVGRPPKKDKKKYYGGGSVDPFSTRNAKGVPAEQMAEAMDNQNMANKGIPTTNAPDRVQTSPDVEQYNKGGKVTEIKSMPRMPLRGGKKVSDPKKLEQLKKQGKSPIEGFKERHILELHRIEKEKKKRKKK